MINTLNFFLFTLLCPYLLHRAEHTVGSPGRCRFTATEARGQRQAAGLRQARDVLWWPSHARWPEVERLDGERLKRWIKEEEWCARLVGLARTCRGWRVQWRQPTAPWPWAPATCSNGDYGWPCCGSCGGWRSGMPDTGGREGDAVTPQVFGSHICTCISASFISFMHLFCLQHEYATCSIKFVSKLVAMKCEWCNM
jgi:hypothetical protein